MKGTKLWQSAGSPIIQGRSRRQRPSWQQWLPAWILAAAAVTAAAFLIPGMSLSSPWRTVGAVLGALLGAILGVEVTRAMGWRFPLVWGVIVGVGGAVLLAAMGVTMMPA